MYIHYERSRITGTRKQEGGRTREITEDITCLQNQDPMLLAVRRNHALAGCGRISVETLERFTRYVDEEPYRSRSDIPVMNSREEYDV